MVDKAMKVAVNMLHLANNAPVALTLAAIPTIAGLWMLGGGKLGISADVLSLIVIICVFLIMMLAVKILNYVLLLVVHLNLSHLPQSRFLVDEGLEKTKARIMRSMTEKKVEFFTVDAFSQGERAILGLFRMLLGTAGPQILVSKKPFLLVKLDRHTVEKKEKTLVSVILDQDDVGATTFAKYVECTLSEGKAVVCEAPEVKYLASLEKQKQK